MDFRQFDAKACVILFRDYITSMYETNWSDDDDVIAASLVRNQLSDSEQEYDSLLCFSTIVLSIIRICHFSSRVM